MSHPENEFRCSLLLDALQKYTSDKPSYVSFTKKTYDAFIKETDEAMHVLKRTRLNDNHKVLFSSLLYKMVAETVEITSD